MPAIVAAAVVAALCLLSPCLAAPFAFSNTLSNDAVLQQPVTIWGTGTPGGVVTTTVTVALAIVDGHRKRGSPPSLAKIGVDGIWRQAIDAAEGKHTCVLLGPRLVHPPLPDTSFPRSGWRRLDVQRERLFIHHWSAGVHADLVYPVTQS